MRFARVALEPTMNRRHTEAFAEVILQPLGVLTHAFELGAGFAAGGIDGGHDDVGLLATFEARAQVAIDVVGLVLADHAIDDGRAAGRQFIERGHVQIAKDGQRQRARDGRGGHDQVVRDALGGGCGGFISRFIPPFARPPGSGLAQNGRYFFRFCLLTAVFRLLASELRALLDAEAVLLVDDDYRQMMEAMGLIEQCVRADDDIDLAVGDLLQQRTAGALFGGGCEPVSRASLTSEPSRKRLIER